MGCLTLKSNRKEYKMETIEKDKIANTEFGVFLEESASFLTKGSNGRNMEHHYVPFLKP